MHVRKLLEDLDHAVVVLEGVHTRPGQFILAGYEVFVERLMHVPEEAEMDSRHELLVCQRAAQRAVINHAQRVSCRRGQRTTSRRFLVAILQLI